MPVTKVKVNGEWIPAMPVGGSGEGDMTKAVYDTNDDGVVNAADQATKDGSGNVITTTYAAKATTLSGYGITDAKIQNGSIILGSNTITPLTSFTETDPVFTASVAYGISSSDISNWNSKADSATTLSGYGITDAYISSGTITLGNNTITPLTSFTETDPTVPSWAKAASKPTYTAAEVSAISTSAKGAANGVAELDSNGLVPSSQLPSYVDDVLEYNAKSSFPSTGETGKIYVDTSTNLTYRWSGSAYVEISPSLALGTTSSTAFRGDYGNAAYAHAVTNKGSAFTSGLYKITTNSEGHVTAAVAATASDIPGLSGKADSATTLAGYGITDAKIESGTITLGSNTITPLTSHQDISGKVSKTGDTMTGYLNFTNWMGIKFTSGEYSVILTANGFTPTQATVGFNKLTLLQNIATPSGNTDAANKKYVDDAISGIDLSDYIASDEIGKVYVSDTEPSNTSNYDIWIDTSTTLQNANGVMV